MKTQAKNLRFFSSIQSVHTVVPFVSSILYCVVWPRLHAGVFSWCINIMGRPTKYSDTLIHRICTRIAAGESLVKICREPRMPARSTVMDWLLQHEDFADKYARAKELCAELYADEIIEIADDGRNDTYKDDRGNIRTDHDVVQRSKLRVDARKWSAARLAPKKYGDKIQQELTGANGTPLAQPMAQVVLTTEKLEEVAKRLADEV